MKVFHAAGTEKPQSKKKSGSFGFSALEIIIALSLVALIVAVLSPFFTAVSRSWEKDRKLKEQVQQARDAMDFIVYELKKSNGIIDGSSADFSTTVTLDSNYVIFSSAGDEIVLDDKNTGYKANGTINSKTGAGFANDYDATTAGYATYEFKTVLPGLYDLYAYNVATSGATAQVGVFDDTCYSTIVPDISTTYSQGAATALTWYQANCSDAAFCTNKFGGVIKSLDLTAGGGAGGDCIGIQRLSGGTSNVIIDAFRLVYRGIRHKVFVMNPTKQAIYYGDDDVSNDGSDANDPVSTLYDNTSNTNSTLLSNAMLIPGTPFLQYFQADGITSAASSKEVALIKIAFQINDPTGNLPPYPLRAEVALEQDPSTKRLVINEIFKEENETEIAEERFDGNSYGDGNNGDATTAGQADGGWYGFATNVDDIDGDGDNDLDMNGNGTMDNDAWLSATETFIDDTFNALATGWTALDCADAGEFCRIGIDDGNSMFVTATDASDNTGVFFYENSRNYTAVIDFKIPCNERQTFSFRMRHTDTTDNISAEFYVDETGGTDVACVRIRRDMNGVTANYPSGVDAECGSGGVSVALLDDNAIGNYDIYDDAEWHRLVVQDVYYTATVWLSEGAATKSALDAFTSANYTKFLNSINYDPSASRLDAYDVSSPCSDAPCVGVKGFEVDDTLNGTATDDNACPAGAGDDPAQLHIGNVRIWSLDWKPVGYLTTFDDDNTVWDTDSGGNTPFMVRAAVDPAFGPMGDHTTGVGGTGMVLTSARDTDGDELVDSGYSTVSTQTVNHRNNSNITLGENNRDMGDVGGGNQPYYTFQYLYWWQWMDLDGVDDDVCGFAINDLGLTYPNDFAPEASLYPVNQSACGGNSYGGNPNAVYDSIPTIGCGASCVGASFETRLWTADHACWVQMKQDLDAPGYTSGGNHKTMEMSWRFSSNNAGADGAGWFIDDMEIYPSGIWNIEDEDGADNYKGRSMVGASGLSCLATGSGNGSYGDGGAEEDYLHAAVESPLIRVTAVQDFNAIKVSYLYLMDLAENNGDDGYFVQYSINGGAWKSVGSTGESYFTLGGYDGLLSCNVPYDPGSTNQNDVGCNESAFFSDRTAWTQTDFVVEDDAFSAGATFRFRFVFTSDTNSNGQDGVLIDNVRVIGLQRNYQWIELYNPTPHSIDVDGAGGANNWRIVTDGHTGSSDSYDAIRALGGGNAAPIPPGGYAVITQQQSKTRFYDGTYFAAPPASAIQLEIDDDFFGYRGLGTQFGKITLQDDTGNTIDNVNYNLVFFDQVEYDVSQSQDSVWYNWSTLGNDTGTADGVFTQFWVGNPTRAGTGRAQKDHTSGKYSLDNGECFMLRNPSAGTPEEDYDDDDAVELRTNALDLTQTSVSTVGNLEFWYFMDTDDTDDGFIVQLSSTGGSQFVMPFTGAANDCLGKLKDGTAEGGGCVTGTDRIEPNYNGAMSSGTSSINAQASYNRDQRAWRRVTAQLTDFIGTQAILRFYWESDNSSAGTISGLYLDDIAVWYHWGGGIFQKTLERKSWRGGSNKAANWGTSTADYGSPGTFNGIGTN